MGKLLPLKAPAIKRIEGDSNPSGLATHLQVSKAKASHQNLTAGTSNTPNRKREKHLQETNYRIFFWFQPLVFQFSGVYRILISSQSTSALSKLPNAAAEDHCCAKATPWKRRMMNTSTYLG